MGLFGKKKEEKPAAQPPAPDVSMEEIKRVLKATDKLLGHLPPQEIEEFTRSEEFKLYRNVLHKLVPEAELQPEEAAHYTPEHLGEIEQLIDMKIKEYFARAQPAMQMPQPVQPAQPVPLQPAPAQPAVHQPMAPPQITPAAPVATPVAAPAAPQPAQSAAAPRPGAIDMAKIKASIEAKLRAGK